MRVKNQTTRRVITRAKRGLMAALGVALVATSALVHTPVVGASAPVDDYPRRLKAAAQDALVDPWNFYNRECTSFVAWRLNNNNSVPFHNYYLDVHWGDASNWKNAATSAGVRVDGRPTHGSVAWWAAGSPGSSRGHVAWVQRVGASSITIEEYNWAIRGGYGIRTIDESSSMWPSGFIHVGKTFRLRNVDPPTIAGVAQVGERLIAKRGSWSSRGADFRFRWFADGKPIGGATRKTLRLSADERGARIQVRVLAAKLGMKPGSATSAKTSRTAAGEFVVEDAPSISGNARVGRTLRAAKGTWSPRGSYAYQWYAGRKPIAGATDKTFTPSARQLDKPLTVKVSATRDGYRSAASKSGATGKVAPGTFVTSEAPGIVGTAQVGVELEASPGSWSPTAHYAYQWFADGVLLEKATKRAYTPHAAQVRKKLTVEVTATKRGYTPASRTSASTTSVAPGSFVNTRAPSIKGKAQVGMPLTADPGVWSPKARFRYQWYADGTAVHGATGKIFRPTAAQLGQRITLEVTARRPGYLTAVVRTAATHAVAPGDFENLERPSIAGRGFVGRKLIASAGTWSPDPTNVRYQWLSDGKPIAVATDRSYVLRRADGGHSLSVRVVVGADGYQRAKQRSEGIDVLFGTASFAEKPTIRGQAVVGKTLTVRSGPVTPRRADLTYQWYRDDALIRGATDQSYVPTRRDVGAHLSVVVTISAEDWAPASRRADRTPIVRDPG